MTAMEIDFLVKITITFLVAGIVIYYMNILQKRKEDKAEKKFQEVLKGIEMRNKIYKPKDDNK